jgi:hypothetical protein
MAITRKAPLLIHQVRKKVIPVCFAAAPGSTSPGTCDPPSATGTFRPPASAATAFVLPEVRQRASCPAEPDKAKGLQKRNSNHAVKISGRKESELMKRFLKK